VRNGDSKYFFCTSKSPWSTCSFVPRYVRSRRKARSVIPSQFEDSAS